MKTGWTEPIGTLVKVHGQEADAGLLDDSGEQTYKVKGGPHDGHTVEIYTAKHNCGAYAEDVYCSCGAEWHNRMDGCWQHGHQREESGDTSLRAMTTLAYERT